MTGIIPCSEKYFEEIGKRLVCDANKKLPNGTMFEIRSKLIHNKDDENYFPLYHVMWESNADMRGKDEIAYIDGIEDGDGWLFTRICSKEPKGY